MIVETKFEMYDELWFMMDNKPVSGKVISINAEISSPYKHHQVIIYMMSYKNKNPFAVSEHNLFKTREEVIASL